MSLRSIGDLPHKGGGEESCRILSFPPCNHTLTSPLVGEVAALRGGWG
jgi:hypothetical protein